MNEFPSIVTSGLAVLFLVMMMLIICFSRLHCFVQFVIFVSDYTYIIFSKCLLCFYAYSELVNC